MGCSGQTIRPHPQRAQAQPAAGHAGAAEGMQRVTRVGVVGAGTMGSGITRCMLDAGLAVTLVDVNAAMLDAGTAGLGRGYASAVKRGKLVLAEADERLARLSSTTSIEDLAGADLIVEAIFEDLALKQKLFARLDHVAGPEAVLASNTSFLDIDAIARDVQGVDRVLGMHFFSPAHVMRLLEVIPGAATSATALETAIALGRRIGKATVVSGNAPGFIANRAMAARSRAADLLVVQGRRPLEVDRVLTNYGFPLGHFAMMDLAGIDVAARIAGEDSMAAALVAVGRKGRKSGAGFFDYGPDGTISESPIVAEVLREHAVRQGVAAHRTSDREMLEILLYPVVNEVAQLLEGGVARSASDVDLAAVEGYAWPKSTGGPACWADTVGLAHIVTSLEAFADRNGAEFAPGKLLRELAANGGSLARALARSGPAQSTI